MFHKRFHSDSEFWLKFLSLSEPKWCLCWKENKIIPKKYSLIYLFEA